MIQIILTDKQKQEVTIASASITSQDVTKVNCFDELEERHNCILMLHIFDFLHQLCNVIYSAHYT